MKYRRLISAVLSLFAVLVANAAGPSDGNAGAFGYCKPVYFNSSLDVFTRFYGYCSVGAMYELGRLSALVRLSPVFDGFNVNANAELAWRLGKDIASPFHVFLQYNHGYDEAMCDWIRGFDTGHTLRFGFMISPSGAVRLRQ